MEEAKAVGPALLGSGKKNIADISLMAASKSRKLEQDLFAAMTFGVISTKKRV